MSDKESPYGENDSAASDQVLSPELVHSLLESAPDAILVVDSHGAIRLVNSQVEVLFGYKRQELLGQAIEVLIPWRIRCGHALHRVNYSNAPRTRPMGAGLDLHGLRRDGTEFPVEISLSPVQTRDELLIVSVIRDITERKRVADALRAANEELDARVAEQTAQLRKNAEDLQQQIVEHERSEQQLRQSEEKVRLLIEGVIDYSIYMLDPEGKVNSWNAGAERLYGYSSDEILWQPCSRFYLENEQPDADIGLKRAMKEGRHESDGWRRRKDGSKFWASTVITPLRNSDQALRGFSVIVRDMTDRRTLEQQLRQSQKMEAVGRLAAGVAHDFNNLLMVIQANADMVLTESADGKVVQRIGEIRDACDRASVLIRQLLTFGQRTVVQPQSLDVQAALRDVSKLLPSLVGENIAISITNAASLSPVTVDPGQLSQVLINLAANARDAMPNGGRLGIDTDEVVLDEYYTGQHLGVLPGRYVMIAISDTGHGMDAETQAHIFEPFFSTKPQGKGSGLGLSIVHGIMKQCGGHINVYSEPGIGSVIKLFFPISTSAAIDSVRRSVPLELSAKRPSTVLLVEDELALRQIIGDVLRAKGFNLLEATNGREALQLCKLHRESIDVVVTDIVMPDLGGVEIAQTLCQMSPSTKVIFMSGYTDKFQVVTELPNSGGLLNKPFALDELVTRIVNITEKAIRE